MKMVTTSNHANWMLEILHRRNSRIALLYYNPFMDFADQSKSLLGDHHGLCVFKV
jgi:hypothetical protein